MASRHSRLPLHASSLHQWRRQPRELSLGRFGCSSGRLRVRGSKSTFLTELAEITEHVSAWVDTAFDAERFLSRFDLTAQERSVLAIHRALFALEWLHVLFDQDPGLGLNPPACRAAGAARSPSAFLPSEGSKRRSCTQFSSTSIADRLGEWRPLWNPFRTPVSERDGASALPT